MAKKLFSVLIGVSLLLQSATIPVLAENKSINVVTEYPTDNLLVNGGFEDGLNGWTVSNPKNYISVEESFGDDEGKTKTAVNGNKTLYISSHKESTNNTIGYIEQEIDATANTNYVLNFSWYDLYKTYANIEVYGDTVSDENRVLDAVQHPFSGNVWYSSAATFNSGEHEKLILRIEFFTGTAGDRKYAIDNITLKAAGNTQTINFENGIPEDLNIRSTDYSITDEKVSEGNYSIKLISGNGYPMANAAFALNPNRHYAIIFDYYIESGSLGYALKYAHENGFSAYQTGAINGATLTTKGTWGTEVATPKGEVTGSGDNSFVEIAFQNMATNSVIYIDNIRCKYYDESIDSITLTGNNESGGAVRADVSAYNYGYDFEDPLTYQWQRSEDKKNWIDIVGATDEEYLLTRADSNKYLRIKVNTSNRYNDGISDAYYSKSVKINDVGYKHEKGASYGIELQNETFSVDEKGAAANFECVNKTDKELDFKVFVGAYSDMGELMNYFISDYSNVTADGMVSVEKSFTASGINKLRIVVFDDDMNIYYTEILEKLGSEQNENTATFNKETQEITVTGKNNGKPELVIVKDKDENIEYITVADCGEETGFEVKTSIKADDYGKHSIYTSYFKPYTFFYYSQKDYEEILNSFNGDMSKEQVLDAYRALEIDTSIFNELDTDKLTETVNSGIGEITGDTFESKMESAEKILKKLLILEAYNQKINGLTDSDGKIIYEDELGLTEIDTEGTSFYELYSTLLNKEGLEKLDKMLKSKEFKNVEDFEKSFKQAVIMCAVSYPNVGGVGYVGNVLTRENIASAEVNAEKFLAKTDKEKELTYEAVAKKSYEIIADLEKAINADVSSSNGSSSGGSSGGSSKGSSSGSVSSGKTMVMTKPVNEQTESISDVYKFPFEDIDENNWAYKYVYALNEAKIVTGVNAVRFNPNGTVTREEFVKMLCEALNIQMGAEEKSFDDLESGAWYERYVNIASSQGIANGTGNGKFGIGRPITRQDICVMSINALKTDVRDNTSTFTDMSDISEYAVDAVMTLKMFKVISGFDDGSFRPLEYCTRAQASKIIFELMDIQKIMESEEND